VDAVFVHGDALDQDRRREPDWNRPDRRPDQRKQVAVRRAPAQDRRTGRTRRAEEGG
jgi:hypothetical protein